MGEKVKKASESFGNGLNCAQSVFGAFCDRYGVTEETAVKIACGLGSGARSAELCGAVSGAVLVIGLKYGESKEMCNQKTEEFMKAFKDANNDIVCRNLLGCDITTPSGREKAVADNLFKTKCLDLVKSAADILEKLGY